MSEEIKLFKVTIDGQTTEVLPGTTIIEAARKIGGKSVHQQCVIIANWSKAVAVVELVW